MIRSAELHDALGIAKVHVKTWQQAYSGLMPSKFLQSLTIESRINSWKFQIKDDITTVIVDDKGGLVRGFVAGGRCRDNDYFDYSEVYAIYVSPEYQGQGIGKTLLDDFLKLHTNPCSLWVLSNNEPSINFYKSKGFLADGSTKPLRILDQSLEESQYVLKIDLEN